jgi:hypothetical protein
MNQYKLVLILVLALLVGCVSSAQMDEEFYLGMEQRSGDFSEALGDVAVYVGMYEGSPSVLQSEDWKFSILDTSSILEGRARGLYSITNTYCPQQEKRFCDDIEEMYARVSTFRQYLKDATSNNSTSIMNQAIDEFDEILILVTSMQR